MVALWMELQILGEMYVAVAGLIASIPSLIGVMALVRIRAVSLILVAGFVGAVLSGYAFSTLAL